MTPIFCQTTQREHVLSKNIALMEHQRYSASLSSMAQSSVFTPDNYNKARASSSSAMKPTEESRRQLMLQKAIMAGQSRSNSPPGCKDEHSTTDCFLAFGFGGRLHSGGEQLRPCVWFFTPAARLALQHRR
jgi:hypothetical protein